MKEKVFASVEARKVLDGIWKDEAQLKGRCWGPKKNGNLYGGTNITIAVGNELVSVSEDGKGSLKIHEFVRSGSTALGGKIKNLLAKNGLAIKQS
ncbi:MAG: hypothetical protein PHP03_02440 [Candidatus Pacebacteria bacterium]|nr:hypothetical protein [Candidatus Paceibacterota bacterium]